MLRSPQMSHYSLLYFSKDDYRSFWIRLVSRKPHQYTIPGSEVNRSGESDIAGYGTGLTPDHPKRSSKLPSKTFDHEYLRTVRLLEANPKASLSFELPSGEIVPPHFHLTEVGRVHKTFIDCGGTKREAISCQLQLWSANDFDHRLAAGKLLKIMEMAAPLLDRIRSPSRWNTEKNVASIYTIGDVVNAFGVIRVSLLGKQTDCLAKDKCGVAGCCEDETCC